MPSRIEDAPRPAGLSSFAFQTPEAFQGQSAQSGAMGASGIVGGQTQGGDRSAAGQNPFDAGAVIGSFLDDIAKPYAQAKASEKFFEGYTKQMLAGGVEELKEDNNPLTTLFGSHAQDGAAAYAAQERVSKVQQQWAEDQAELVKLDPAGISKEVAKRMQGALTGIPIADGLISTALMQSAPGMLQATAKGAIAYRQEQANARAGSATLAAGQAFNKQAALYSAAGGADQVGLQNAMSGYLRAFAGVEGQTVESRQKVTFQALSLLAQEKQGFAITAASKSGVIASLPMDDQVKLNDVIQRRGRLAALEAIATDTAVLTEFQELERAEAYGLIESPADLVARQQKINGMIAKATGFEYDYFRPEDTVQDIEGYYKEQARKYEKAQDAAAHAAALRAAEQAREDREAAKERDAALAASGGLAASDPVLAWDARGVTKDGREAAMNGAWTANDLPSLNRAFKHGAIATSVQALIRNSIATAASSGDTSSFLPLVDKFTGMMGVNAAMAKGYFGAYYPMLLNYKKLIAAGMQPPVAMAQSLDDTQYLTTANERGAGYKAAQQFIKKQQPNWTAANALLFGQEGKYPLNASGQQALANQIGNEIAVDTKAGSGDLSAETQAQAAYNKAIASGAAETLAGFAWRQRAGTPSIWRSMGTDQARAQTIARGLIDRKLKERGFTQGANAAEYDIHRATINGVDHLLISGVEDGMPAYGKGVAIPIPEFKAAADQARKQVTQARAVAEALAAERAAIAAWKKTFKQERRTAADGSHNFFVSVQTQPKPATPLLDAQEAATRRAATAPRNFTSAGQAAANWAITTKTK